MKDSNETFYLYHHPQKDIVPVFMRPDFDYVFFYTFLPISIYLILGYLILPIILKDNFLIPMITTIENKIHIPELDSVILNFFLLVFYLLTIYVTYRRIKKFYKKNRNTSFNGTEISAIFNISILLNIPCVFAIFLSSYIKSFSNDIFRSYCLSIIISSLLLYLGFIFPLDDIFSGTPTHKFHYFFIKPFKDVGVKFSLVFLIITVVYSIFLSCNDKIQCKIIFGLLIIIIIFVFVVFIFEKIRSKRIIKFIESFKSNSKTLILILGEDILWTERLSNKIHPEKLEKLDFRKKYDTVIVIDRRSEKTKICFPNLNKFTKASTQIFDPFVNNKKQKKSFFAAWCGYPFLRKYKFTRNEYLKLLTKHPNQSFDITQNQNTL